MANITRIKNNQITDANVVAYAKLQSGTITGNLFAPSVTINSNVTITGNLTTFGTVDSISATNTYVNDPLVVFNNGFNGTPSYDIGILVNRNLQTLPGYGAVNTAWIWEENTQTFQGIATTETGSTQGQINNSGFANLQIGAITASSLSLSSSISTTGGATFGGAVQINNTLGVSGATTLSSTLTTSGVAKFNSNIVAAASTTSTSTTTGSIISAGGIGLVGNLISGAQVQANNGLYSVSTFNGGWAGDGIVVDYTSGMGRISVGGSDGVTIYNGGVANTALVAITSGGAVTATGSITTNSTTASTSTTTGSLIAAGGAGIAGNVYFGGASYAPTSTASAPSYSFATGRSTGMYYDGSYFRFALNGTDAFIINNTGPYSLETHQFINGSASAPSIANGGWPGQGFYFPSNGVVGVATGGFNVASFQSSGSNSSSSTTGAFVLTGGAGISGNVVAGGQVQAANGLYSTGTLSLGYTDGIVVDYTNGMGRISVGSTDGLTIYNGGVANTALLQIASSGVVTVPATTASTSTTTGALVVNGGLGVAGAFYAGSIQNTPIGNATPSTGAFTTLSSTSTTTLGLTTAAAINNTPIGNATPSTGAFTTVSATSSGTGGAATITYTPSSSAGSALQLTGKDTQGGVGYFDFAKVTNTTSGGTNGNKTFRVDSVGSLQIINSAYSAILLQLTDAGVLNTTSIQSTPIGSSMASTGAFTTLTAQTETVGGLQAVAIGNVTPGTAAFTTATTSGLQATAIGNVTPGTGVFTNFTAGTTTLGLTTAAAINNTPIGNATPSTGAFTTLSMSGIVQVTNGTNNSGTAYSSGALQVTGGAGFGGNVYVAGNLFVQGTTYESSTEIITGNEIVAGVITANSGTASTSTSTGALVVNGGAGVSGAIYAGSIQATPIGATTASTGKFTTLQSTSTTTLGATTATSLDSTPIGAGTASTGAFTTLTASGATTITSSTASTNYTNGALVVTGGVGIGGNLNVHGTSSFIGLITTGDVNVGGNINAAVGAVASYNGQFYGNAQTGFNALYAGLPTGYSLVPNELAQFTGNANAYVQINTQNLNNGSAATTDWIATANNGTDTTFYVDMGIAGSGYNNTNPNNSLGTSLFPNDAYLYAQGQASSFGGNLVVGTTVAGTVTKIIAGGVNASSVIGTFSSTGLTLNQTTASTNTTTGALVVNGGVGIAGALNVGGAFNVTGTLSTTNAQISGGYITGTPISGSTGSFTYLTATTGFSTANAQITGGAITSTPISGSTGSFTYLTATTGFSTANAVISGGAIASTAITGTVATANVSMYSNVAVNASNATFYPTFVNTTSGNVAEWVNSALTFNPSNGTLSSTTFSGIGAFSTLSTSGVSVLGGNVVITSQTDVTSPTTGALMLMGTGGLNVGGNAYVGNNLYIGSNAINLNLTTPTIVAVDNGASYAQAAIQNRSNTGSADWIAYGNNYPGSTNDHGWVDVGFTGDAFNDPNYTITKPNDGYVFASGANASVGGNLVLSTDYTGSFNDVVIGVGSFSSTAEVARFHGNVSTSGNFTIKLPTNPAPAANVGAFQVWGGSSVSGNAYVGGYTVLGGSQTAGSDTVVKGKNDSSLIWARSGTTYDQVLVGGIATNATLTNYAKFAVNSVDSMLLPVGMSSQRPSNLGGVDVAGMLRYNTTLGTLEWFNGSAWTSTGASFTIIVDQQFNGDGSTVAFTLTKSATTAGVLININGVSQIPTLAYSVSGTTLTFTEAPQVGDVIDVRILTTQVSVNNVSSVSGNSQVLLDQTINDNTIRLITSGNEAINIDPNGNWVQKVGGRINSTPTVTVAATPTAIDIWSGANYKVAKYLVSAHNAGNTAFTAIEALVVTDGSSTVNITTYNTVNAGGTAQVSITAAIAGGTVTVSATGATAGTVVKFDKVYL
jgi:hypothetical protein